MANSPMGAVCFGSKLFASILNPSVMLGNYLQQTTLADDIFRCIFFLGALRVKAHFESQSLTFLQFLQYRVQTWVFIRS